MRKILLIIGIGALVIGVGSLLYSALMWVAYKNTLDASPAFYANRHSAALSFLIAGIVISLAGIACLYFRSR